MKNLQREVWTDTTQNIDRARYAFTGYVIGSILPTVSRILPSVEEARICIAEELYPS